MLLWTGCADNAYMGDNEEATKGVNGAIAFGSSFQAITRADVSGAAAADALGGTFIVNGFKFAGETRQDVFRDYTVNWESNSAGTTLTNTSGWDYAGINNAFATPPYEQTIKYWDWSQDYYNFAAYSVGKGNAMVLKKRPSNDIDDDMTDIAAPAANQIYVAPFEYQHITQWPYFLRGSREDLCECYISDMTTVEKGNFGNEVKLRFRNLASKIRLAFYETIPGYSVEDVVFYGSTARDIHNSKAMLIGVGAFGTDGTFKILYPTIGSSNVDNPDYNRAHVGHEVVNTVNYQDFGTMNYTGPEGSEPAGNHYLGRTVTTATFAGNEEVGYYTKILPYEETTKSIELLVDYTLRSTDITRETIHVYNAHITLPSAYTIWQPNCAYTYIFKISDNTIGWTIQNPGISDPAGLYPITLDAVTIDDGYGSQETITTIAEPSITTYAKASDAIADKEYRTGSNIYVVVDKGGTVQTLSGSNAKLYVVTNNTGDGEEQTLSEINVAKALTDGVPSDTDSDSANDTWTLSVTGMKDLKVTTLGVPELTTITQIAAADSPTGLAITINGVRFTPENAATYAFEFTDTADENKKYYKVIKVRE